MTQNPSVTRNLQGLESPTPTPHQGMFWVLYEKCLHLPKSGTPRHVKSAGWLLMPWHPLDARSSATITLTCIHYSNVKWAPRHLNSPAFDCLFSSLSKHTSKIKPKLHIIGLCEGNPPVTGGFPSHRASNSENISISWCHNVVRWSSHNLL